MVKILAIGHSIVTGRVDLDTTRPQSPNAPWGTPEGGWLRNNFQIRPRWGTRDGSMPINYPNFDGSCDGGPGWVVRATDYLPTGAIQVYNEGYAGSVAAEWDTSGNNYIDAIFARTAFEQLPADISYAVFAIMANDTATATATWKAQVERVIQYLNTKNIKTILVKDWFRGGYATAYDSMSTAVDELVAAYGLPPALDLRTHSEANFNGTKDLYYLADGYNVHPNTNGHIVAAKLFANYLVTNYIVADANAKRISAPWNETGKTVYAIVRREADGYYLDDVNGTFAANPSDKYILLPENPTVKGLYEIAETRSAWNDGRYTITAYKQAGGSPAPASDTIVGTGEMWTVSDAEVAVDTAVSSRLATASYTAPDNAGIANLLTMVTKLHKMEIGRLKQIDNPDGTKTFTYYEDNAELIRIIEFIVDSTGKIRSVGV